MTGDKVELDDALYVFMRRVDVIVSLEIGNKISTKEAYKDIKNEVRKLKKQKKAIDHENFIAAEHAATTSNVVQLDWDGKFFDPGI